MYPSGTKSERASKSGGASAHELLHGALPGQQQVCNVHQYGDLLVHMQVLGDLRQDIGAGGLTVLDSTEATLSPKLTGQE